jgi:succinoglycan biosynthesis transport protein ExoP
VDSFRISYVSDSPEKARLVTDRLARLYMDQNSADRSNQANMTSEFLDAQLAQAKQRLIEQEERLEQYRRANAGQLPSQMQSNLQAIQNANVQLQAVHDSTNRAQERRLLIERQLADARAWLAAMAQPEPAAANADGTEISTARQLEAARTRLTLLLQRNTPDHPDVLALERVVQDLEGRLAAETAAAEATSAAARQPTPQEVAQQRHISDLEAQLEVIKYQIASNQRDVERLQGRMVELTRDYSTMQAAYSDLLMKRENAVIAANLEHRRIGEQFRLVDAASRPERPDNQPQRIAIMSSGALVGLLLGMLLAGLSEWRDSSFRRPEEVLAFLSVPVLASIPLMQSRRERRRTAWRRFLADAAGVAVLASAAVLLVFWRLQG